MRVHSIPKNHNSQSQFQSFVVDESEAKPICPVCGRSFRSMKFMFGHMRCHPERQYRGIKDPKEKNTTITAAGLSTSSSSFDDCNNEFDLTKNSLPWNWSITGKRGRKSISSGTTTSTTTEEEVNYDEDEELQDAVQALLSLRNPFLLSEVANSTNSLTNQLSPEIGSTNFMMELDDAQLNMDVLPIINQEQEQTMIATQSEMKGKRKLILEQDDISNKKIHVESVSSEDQKYFECNICNKCFSTHQALGGHKSSHNKHITKIQNPTNNNAQQSSNFGIKIKLKTSSSIINSTSLHQCKICSKTFSTGQALGGHMRAHFIENSENSSSQVITSDEASSDQTIRIAFPFDLNDPPPIDHEGDEIYTCR